jgi:hypothetical protein
MLKLFKVKRDCREEYIGFRPMMSWDGLYSPFPGLNIQSYGEIAIA